VVAPVHTFGLHVAADNVPARQLDAPDTTKLRLHVGRHFDPDGRLFVQVPTTPFAGGVDASHGFGMHVAAVNFPAVQLDVPDTV
jgi:hypothetical protein